MLRKPRDGAHREGDLLRTFYLGDDVDLITWCSERGELEGFQITYRRDRQESALTWRSDTGFAHDRVDDGEAFPGRYKMSPILRSGGDLDRGYLLSLLEKEGEEELDPELRDAIARKVRECPLSAADYLQAKWDGKIDDALWLGWQPASRIDSASDIAKHSRENPGLPPQVLELLGAWAVLLCLRESRWAPAGTVVDSTVNALRDFHLSLSPECRPDLQRGIDRLCEELRSIGHGPTDGIVEAAVRYFAEMLQSRFRE